MENILPDSRAQNVTFGSQMVDWPLPSGKTVRLEAVMVYCANCCKPFGYVPKENTTFACYICNQCFEKNGLIPGTFAQPDEQFCQDVAYECEQRFGHTPTEVEVFAAAEQGLLGTALEKLSKDSPYRVPNA
jgi:hypothetical protein